ncbi:MAG: replication protein [Syntrophales bacterium]|nr:replication protein [Syntrophales bacterium]
MANPQTEDGFTKIANEIMDALCHIRIPGEEMQVLNAILRKTYGWNKCEDSISLGQLSQMTGINRPNVARALKSLLSKKIASVIKSDNRGINILKFNKNYDEWVLSKPITAKKRVLSKVSTEVLSKPITKVLSKLIPTKEKKEKKESPPFILPDFIPLEAWQAYMAVRVKKRAAQTPYAFRLIIKELEKIKKNNGHDPIDVLNKSIKNGWTDVYPLKDCDTGAVKKTW